MISRRDFLLSSLCTGAIFSRQKSYAKQVNAQIDYQLKVENWAKKLKKNTKPLVVLYPKGSLANISPIVKSFEKATAHKIQLKEAPTDNITTEMLLAVSVPSRAFDVALPPTFSIPDLVESNAIVSFDKFFSKYKFLDKEYNYRFNIGGSYRAKTYGYQTDGDVYLMFYKKSLLDNPVYQRKYEDQFKTQLHVPATWREVDQQIRFFHRPEIDLFGGSLFRNRDYIHWEFWSRLHANGSLPVDDNMQPLINSQIGINTLEAMIQITPYLAPKNNNAALFENFSLYSAGNIYCNIGWGGTQKYITQNNATLANDILHTPMPGSQSYIPFFNWGWNYTISSLSTNQELAYLFCLYAVTPELSKLAIQQVDGYFDPFISEHYNDKTIQKIYGSSFLSAHKQSMQQCIPDFYIKGQGYYLDVLKENLWYALNGFSTPKTALDITANYWNKITDALGRDKQSKQWLALKKTYPKEILETLTNIN